MLLTLIPLFTSRQLQLGQTMSTGLPASSVPGFSLYPGAGTMTPTPPITIDPSLPLPSQSQSQSQPIELGRTRCYWAILSPALDFVFVDPILHTHLADECSKFIGTSLLEYVHPEEVVKMSKDLVSEAGGGVEGGGVFGSMTR